MNAANVRIVADSSCDMSALNDIPFVTAPLKIITTRQEYVDDTELDVRGMVEELEDYKGRTSTSCPNVGDWLRAFGDAEQVFCVTITGTLSGSYNAAVLAAGTYEEMYPGRRVFVMNSLTTGPEMGLLIEKLRELLLAGLDFDAVCREITAYSEKTGLLFMLESMKNLANNGRVSPLVAKMAGLLGIRVVGKASDQGDLEPLSKCRGERRALEAMVEYMRELGLRGGRVKISHCLNEKAAETLKQMIRSHFEKVRVDICECRGLCSFYAEKGGLLVGFEKN
ncbi:MAG: DegV family protein [Oscillospiraceae bacterium]